MNHLIAQIKQHQITKQAFNAFCSKYLIKQFKIENISPLSAQKIYIKCAKAQRANKITTQNIQNYFIQDGKVKKWYPNELKLFVWTILNYCMTRSTNIEELDYKDFQCIQQIFPSKSIYFLIYMSKTLLKQSNHEWESNQVKIFQQIVEEYPEQKLPWNNISMRMYFQSQRKYFRAPRKCRQFWFNHLNPDINKNQWKVEEDLSLIKSVQQHGFKWSKIAKLLKINRTQHMIKNRVKWLIQKYRKGKKNYDPMMILSKYGEQLKCQIKQKKRVMLEFQVKQQISTNTNIDADISQQKQQIQQDAFKSFQSQQMKEKQQRQQEQLDQNMQIKTEYICPNEKAQDDQLFWSKLDHQENQKNPQLSMHMIDEKNQLGGQIDICQYLNI